MAIWILVSVLVGAAALRVAFLVLHLRNLDRLWSDYERNGPRFQLARALDGVTLVAVLVAAVWAVWGLERQTPYRFARIFGAWLSVSLLMRLPVHRFPQTNQPGALREAKIALVVHLVISLLGAILATAAAAVYFWLRT